MDIAVHIFTEKLTNILDRMAPVRKFQTRVKYASWISQDLKAKIKNRDSAQEKASKTGLIHDWEVYKKKRNEVISLLKKEKESWQRTKIENCEEKKTVVNCGKMYLVGSTGAQLHPLLNCLAKDRLSPLQLEWPTFKMSIMCRKCLTSETTFLSPKLIHYQLLDRKCKE